MTNNNIPLRVEKFSCLLEKYLNDKSFTFSRGSSDGLEIIVNKGDQGGFQCPFSGGQYVTNNINNFQSHLEKYHSDDNTSFKVGFFNCNILTLLKKLHSPGQTTTCDICGSRITTTAKANKSHKDRCDSRKQIRSGLRNLQTFGWESHSEFSYV